MISKRTATEDQILGMNKQVDELAPGIFQINGTDIFVCVSTSNKEGYGAKEANNC